MADMRKQANEPKLAPSEMSVPAALRIPDTMMLLSDWRKFAEASLSAKAVEGYWGVIIRFFLAHPLPLLDVQEEQITEFMTRYAPRSSSRVLAYYGLRHLFRWAKRRHHIVFDPMEHIPTPRMVQRVPTALTGEEL